MPSVLTILAAMSAIVLKAMLETEHHAPISMSVVKLVLTVVMRMQTVSIMRGATLVYVSLDTLEMDFPVLI
jgi:RsiW-degrading membrane proteinase PrsW (M82 family)